MWHHWASNALVLLCTPMNDALVVGIAVSHHDSWSTNVAEAVADEEPAQSVIEHLANQMVVEKRP